MRTPTSRATLQRSHRERSATPLAACSSHYPGYSFRIPFSPTLPVNIAVCSAFFSKRRGHLFRCETLHDRRDSHTGRLAAAPGTGAEPTRSTCAKRTALALLRNPRSGPPFELPIDRRIALLQLRATSSAPSPQPVTWLLKAVRLPIAALSFCSDLGKPLPEGSCGVLQRPAQGRNYPRPALPPEVWRADPIRRYRTPKALPKNLLTCGFSSRFCQMAEPGRDGIRIAIPSDYSKVCLSRRVECVAP